MSDAQETSDTEPTEETAGLATDSPEEAKKVLTTPSTETEPGHEPTAPDAEEEPDHLAVGIGVIGGPQTTADRVDPAEVSSPEKTEPVEEPE